MNIDSKELIKIAIQQKQIEALTIHIGCILLNNLQNPNQSVEILKKSLLESNGAHRMKELAEKVGAWELPGMIEQIESFVKSNHPD